VLVHSSAPTRLDLAGGTLDIWPLYLFHSNSQTLNAALSLKAECTVSTSEDQYWHLESQDTEETITIADLDDSHASSKNRLLYRVLQHFRPDPVRITTRSDSPVGAGLAGSSALTVALCAALSRYTETSYSPNSLMSLAANLEVQVIGVPTGVQDYRPAMYGGVAAIEMGPAGVTRTKLKVDPKELSRRIIIAYTGQSRNSGINNWEITKRHINGDDDVIELLHEISKTAAAMRAALEAADWAQVSRQVANEWKLRKCLAPTVTTPTIEKFIQHGLVVGAQAAKICGAGGGGCILFIADPLTVPSIRKTLKEKGASVLDTEISEGGLQVNVERFPS
jgi:D-glycero-alpha-D-manno-heptose-7-phosphate kinase